MSDHAILSPSSAARRVACPGSRALEALYPQEESPSAREGTAAHWVASEMIKYGSLATVGETAPNGETVTKEMVNGAELYFASVQGVTYGEGSPESQFHVEEKIDISVINTNCWGTPDAWFYSTKQGLHIWDYKFGHAFVEVFENWQLLEYSAGILEQLKVNGIYDQKLFVTFHIVQPRSYHPDGNVRRWSIRASDLRPYFNILRNQEDASLKENATCNPSPECGYCAARHACKALQRSALQAVDLSMDNTPNDLDSISTGNELRYLHHAAKLLASRITGLEAQALSMIKRGDSVPFYSAEATAGRMRWTTSDAEVGALGEMLGFNLLKPVEAITPPQALALGMDKSLLESISERPIGGLKLVADDGKKARKLFGG